METIPYPDRCAALIFDFDGCLVDSMPHHWQAWHTIAERFGTYAWTCLTLTHAPPDSLTRATRFAPPQASL